MRTWLLLLLCGTVATAHAGQFTGKVVAVLDGDTVMVVRNSGTPVKVRLAGIDAPEKEQPFGMASKTSLSELVFHNQVIMNSLAVDIYGRLVALLEVDGNNINEEQVRRGMAWAAEGWRHSRRAPTGVPIAGAYSNYHSNKIYIELQSDAQHARRGLWAGQEIMEPAQWRKLHPAVTTTPRH